MKIAAAVIIYHPDKDVLSNINSYANDLQVVYVLDNTEKNNPNVKSKLETKKLTYIHDGENKGIAIRLNQACLLAKADGFEWLLTMDQDSYFSNNDFKKYLSCISSYGNTTNISMFGVEYLKNNVQEGKCVNIEVEKLITSGSVVNLSAFDRLGGFDEALFIDEVDLDYCYNSINKGFKIIQFKSILLNHSLGVASLHKSFKSFRVTSRTLHSPVRVYYMIRNFLYVNQKYKNQFQEDKERRKKALLNRIKNNILYGKDKVQVIRMIFLALIDYRKRSMGKIKD